MRACRSQKGVAHDGRVLRNDVKDAAACTRHCTALIAVPGASEQVNGVRVTLQRTVEVTHNVLLGQFPLAQNHIGLIRAVLKLVWRVHLSISSKAFS